MSEQNQSHSQGLKTKLKGKGSNAAGGSVKDQVKQALLKNRGVKTGAPSSGVGNGDGGKPSMAQQIAQAQANTASAPVAPNVNINQEEGQVLSKIEQTVDSINEVHSTMESLNRNMNLFVDLFNKRGGSLSGGGQGSGNLPSGGASGGGGIGNSDLSDGSGISGIAGAQSGVNAQGSSNPVTSLLLTNLLKKTDDENEERLKDVETGTPEYLDLLIKKLDKYQHEYELLQYLFEPKLFGSNLQPTEDAQGNSAWLAGFMSMMLKNKK
ncbi:MAG: hypothetical protein ACTSWL_07300 [Promethearchaeota archaeon]